MSGICAIWRQPERSGVDLEALRSFAGALRTAPAETIRYLSDGPFCVAACARSTGQSVYEDSHVLIAYDADVYNDRELRSLLGANSEACLGQVFAGLYERFGVDFVNRLRGAFAVVVWDRAQCLLLAAIDGFGIKRLAYRETPGGIEIATRVDAFARGIGPEPGINPKAIANILNFSSNLSPETIFRDVYRLGPGMLIVALRGNLSTRKFWDMRYPANNPAGETRLADELETLVEQSVAAHAAGIDRDEVGAFLSGGTDSSTVVGMLTRVEGGAPAKAFSIGFEDQQFNELAYADMAAKKFGAKHYKSFVGPDDCFEAIPNMVAAFDEPFGNSSAIPTYFCAKLAADHGIRVLLGGDGGDELFAGNERYLTDKIFAVYQDVPATLRSGLIEPLLRVLPSYGVFGRAGRYVRRANMPGVERMMSFQFLQTHDMADVFEMDFVSALGGYSVLEIPSRHYQCAEAHNHLDRLLYVDTKITLADNDLPKVTLMCEAVGVRSRFPFLDRSLAEFSGTLPPHLKIRHFNKRHLFKRAFRNLLPPEIIRKKKHGFGIPVANWFKSDRRLRELSHDALLSRKSIERGYLRRAFLDELFRRHEQDDSSFYGDTLWACLAVELWHRRVVDEQATRVSLV